MKVSSRLRRVFLFLGLGSVLALVLAGVIALVTSGPTLVGRPVRELVRAAWVPGPEQLKIREMIWRKGSNAVPALVHIIEARPSLGSRVAHQIEQLPYVPRRLRDWAQRTELQEERDREWAVILCGSLNDDAAAARPALIKACGDRNAAVRREATKALLITGVPPYQALPIFLRLLLTDRSPDVRAWAVVQMGLLRREAEPALPALRQAAKDPNDLVASQARETVRRIEEAAASR